MVGNGNVWTQKSLGKGGTNIPHSFFKTNFGWLEDMRGRFRVRCGHFISLQIFLKRTELIAHFSSADDSYYS
jgi:hypothetical protein